MSELIKKFTCKNSAGTSVEGVIDYEEGVGGNKPDIATINANIAANKAKVTLIEDMLAHSIYPTYPYITYTATGLNPVVVRGKDGLLTDPVTTDGSHTVAISKTGFYCAGGDDAQCNIIVTCTAGKAPVVSGYAAENVESSVYDAETNKWRVKCKKVQADVTALTITEATTYSVTYVPGTRSFSEDVAEAPAVVAEGSTLTFKFYINADKSKSGSTPTATQVVAAIASIKIGETIYSAAEGGTPIPESWVEATPGKTKPAMIIPAASINGNIIVTLN